jgi:hypothetical protein
MKSLNYIVLASASLLGTAAMAEGPGNVFPWDRPGYVQPAASNVSRAEVVAQAREAMAAGQIVNGERIAPQESAQPASMIATKTRVQVAAEAREAMRLGLIANGEQPSRLSTPEQEAMITAAGLQARGDTAVAGRVQGGGE